MKNWLLRGALILLSAAAISCENVQSQEFEVTIQNQDIILLDTTGRSCKLQIDGDPNAVDDLTSVKAVLGNFAIRWSGANPLKLAYIKITFRGPGMGSQGSQSITFSGMDLAYIWNGTATLGTIPSSTSAVSSTGLCSFEVGGINISDKSQSTYGQGIIYIYGTTDDGGSTVPVTGEAYFNYAFTATN